MQRIYAGADMGKPFLSITLPASAGMEQNVE